MLKPYQAVRKAIAELDEIGEFTLDDVAQLAEEKLGESVGMLSKEMFKTHLKDKARNELKNVHKKDDNMEQQLDLLGLSERRFFPIKKEIGGYAYKHFSQLTWVDLKQLKNRKSEAMDRAIDDYDGMYKVLRRLEPVMSKNLKATVEETLPNVL